MRPILAAVLIATLTLSACGAVRDSRVNPFNWFGNSRSEPVEAAPENANPLIPTRTGLFQRRRAERALYKGTPIDTVSGLVIERVPGGAIIRATGVARAAGIYDVQLTPENDDEEPVKGVLTYRLEGRLPANAAPGAPARIRTVVVAHAVTDQTLQGVRTIRVEGARNARTSRRR